MLDSEPAIRPQWQNAIEAELQAHKENNTWSVIQRDDFMRPLTARWVFALKRDPTGAIERFKARLVARGHEQRYKRDFEETFAPVTRVESVRVLLALVAEHDLQMSQFDVSTAFLNGQLELEVFMDVW